MDGRDQSVHDRLTEDGPDDASDDITDGGGGSADVTTGNNPTGVPYVCALILVPGGKVHQQLIQIRV